MKIYVRSRGGREDAGWNLEGVVEEVDCAKMSVARMVEDHD